ncbi:MAG: family 43 glycosylhydrolase [Clostridia bacterium]|nr:family 43 glycosylhydrolase [Clostridia bacterium]
MKKNYTLIALLSVLMLFTSACNDKTPSNENGFPDVSYDASTRVAMNEGEQSYTFAPTDYYENFIQVDTRDSIGDPFVMRYDGKYYLYPSCFTGAKLYVYVSDDMINWKRHGVIVEEADGTSDNAYAPEVVYYKGYFYLCESQNGSGHYIFRSESPLGPFERVSEKIGKGIDGDFFLDDDGSLYFLHTSMTTALSYAKVNDITSSNTSEMMGTSRGIANANLNGWTEGPNIFKRGDYYYLTYTGNHVSSWGYRVGYSYVKDVLDFDAFQQTDDYITLISTDTQNSAMGHSSNFVGPNLDSIYTAFHSHRNSGRRYNLTQYLTSNSQLFANGFCDYQTAMPAQPDYSAYGKEALLTSGGYSYTDARTESLFTAELNFKIPNGDSGSVIVGRKSATEYVEIALANDTLSVISHNGNSSTTLASASVGSGNNYQALNIIRVENGADRCFISYNNMRKITLNAPLPSGAIGYGNALTACSTSFSNDSFGTSDFESVKNLPASFPAHTYLKGENRGFSIANAKVTKGGVRQGERQNIEQTDLYNAVILDTKEDYVKYAVNAGKNGWYYLNAMVTEECKGSVLEAVVDESEITKLQVPRITYNKEGYTLVNLGRVYLEEGQHTLKIRLYNGKLKVASFQMTAFAESTGSFTSKLDKEENLFTSRRGNYSFDGGLVTSHTSDVFLTGGSLGGWMNYELSADIQLLDGAKKGGIVVRAKNYSYHKEQTVYSFQGYYIEITPFMISVSKYNYGYENYYITSLTSEDGGSLFAVGRVNNVKVRVKDNTITLYVNGEELTTVTDPHAFYDGQFGFYTENSAFRFSNVVYTEL